jgi:HSP20 family molecular chaperone IbpA
MSKPMSDRLDERQARREGHAGQPGGEMQHVPVNVYESEGALVLVAPLPGVMPDNVEVTVRRGQVGIRAAMRAPAPKDYLIHEWHYGPFERAVDVPEDFGAEVRVSFGNGQLAVSLLRGAAPDEPRTYTPT